MKKINLVNCISCLEYFNREDLEREGFGIEFQDFTNVNIFTENWSKVLDFYLKNLNGFKGIKSMHGAFIDLKPYSYDDYIRQASIFKYEMCLNMAAILDLDYVVFHSQLNPFIHNKQLIELDNNTNARLFNDLVERYNNYKGIILLENVYEWDPQTLRDLLDVIDNEKVKINLDIGHANLSKTHSLEEWFQILGHHIAYCHLHYNDGAVDSHSKPTYEELSKILKVIEGQNINVPLSLEYFPKNIEAEKKLFKEVIKGEKLNFEI